jgi:hypothetical protein
MANRKRKEIMKRWSWMVAALYAALLLVMTVPAILVAFAPKESLGEAASVLGSWGYWLWLAVMFLSQVALLAVPVQVANRRPVTQGPLWRTVLAGGLMAGGLAGGAFLSLYEFFTRGQGSGTFISWTAIGLAALTWCIWTLVFARISRDSEPEDLVSRQCRALLKGSILELLIAVPTHVVARYRDYCCAGILTFIGLTMGVSVMLFAYGPAVFFLFAERWRRLHPSPRKSATA